MSSVFSKPWLQESLLTCSNKVGHPKSITLWLMILILYISSTTATILIVLPQVNVDGNRVPVFFRDRPTYYRKFLVSTLIAFMGAFIALIIRQAKSWKILQDYCCGFHVVITSNSFNSPPLVNVEKNNPMRLKNFCMIMSYQQRFQPNFWKLCLLFFFFFFQFVI